MCDHLADPQLAGYLEDATAVAAIVVFDGGDMLDSSGDHWCIADALSRCFGDGVPAVSVATPTFLAISGNDAVVEDHCTRIHAMWVAHRLSWGDHLAKLSGAAHDTRLVGDVRDPDGVRHMRLRDAAPPSP